MKKKVVIMMLACALSASMLTACGGDDTKKETQKTEASSETDKAKDKSKDKSDSKDYASWSGKEWNKASEDEKTAASEYCLRETTKAATEATGSKWTEELEASVLTDEAVEANKSVLEAAFIQDETIKLSDIIDQASGVVDSMMDQAEEATQIE